MSYGTALCVFSFLEVGGGEKRGIVCDSNCIFTFFVLDLWTFQCFSLRNFIQDFLCLEMFSYGKVAVTVNSWIILQRPLRAAKLKPGLSEKPGESRTSYKLRTSLCRVIGRHETFDFSWFWGGQKWQRQNYWFYEDLSVPLISNRYLREYKTYTRINALLWKGDVPVKWKLGPGSLCFDARFLGTVAKDFPQSPAFVKKDSRNSLMLSLIL